jgi:lysophospholipase L1-like esterase
MPRFERYVAIGDSTSEGLDEGLDDPYGAGGHRGWANRLAERLAAAQAVFVRLIDRRLHGCISSGWR